MDAVQAVQNEGSTPYTCCPIDKSSKEARLAIIIPGSWDEPINCIVKVVPLSVPYPEVLSYAWGDPDITDTIMLNGHKVSVTINLMTALRQLRYTDKTREVWIDAICIDQSNFEERAHQVSQMSLIYGEARKVVVWLGANDDYADLAFETLKAMGKDQALHFNTDLEPLIPLAPFREQHWEACLKILTAPWWDRIWTVQEAVLPSNLTFVCGKYSLHGNILFNGVQNYMHHGNLSCCSHFLQVSTTSQIRSVFGQLFDLVTGRKRNDAIDFSKTIFDFSYRQSYDLRDKVYGLLALSTGAYRDLVAADYTAKVEDVYMKTCLELMRRSNSLSLFDLRADEEPTALRLPSWVTDWSKRPNHLLRAVADNRVRALRLYSASGCTRADVRFVEPDNLIVSGRVLGKIASVASGPTPTWTMDPEDMATICSAWHNYLNLKWTIIQPKYPALQDSLTMVSRLIVGDALRHSDAQNQISFLSVSPSFCAETFPKWQEWMAAGRQSVNSISADLINYNNSLYTTIVGRRLFVTEAGLVGIGPSNIKEGDEAVILCGGRCPYILQPSSDPKERSKQTYRLLGNSYIHGVMNGEAMTAERSMCTLTLI